jgi:hypothetical protein
VGQPDVVAKSAPRPARARTSASAARPVTLRSRRTNDPLVLPSGLNSRSSEGRRWRDLALAYSAQLGDRVKYDGVGTQLRSLLWLSLEVDRMTAERLAGKPLPLHTVLHAAQEVRALLAALGLGQPLGRKGNGDSGSDLHDYLHSKSNGGAP